MKSLSVIRFFLALLVISGVGLCSDRAGLKSSLRDAIIEQHTLRVALEEINRRLEGEEKTTVISRHIAADPMVENLRKRITEKESRLIGLLTGYGPRHPEVVQIQVEIRNIREQLAQAETEAQKEVGRELGINPVFQALLLRKLDVELNLSVQNARIQAIEEQLRQENLINSENGDISIIDAEGIRDGGPVNGMELMQDTESAIEPKENRVELEAGTLAMEHKEEEIRDDVQSVIEEGLSENNASSPLYQYGFIIRFYLLATAGIFLILAGCWVAGNRRAACRIDSAGLKDGEAGKDEGNGIVSFEFPHIMLEDAEALSCDPALVLVQSPDSGGADEVRLLRLRMHKIICNRTPVMFAGIKANSGTTVIAANMAVAVAQTGARVCLVDACLKRAALHKFFNLENDDGLVETLIHGGEPKSRIQQTDISGLDILSAGAKPVNSAELLSSEIMKHLLEKLQNNYDYVILDSPPLSSGADGLALATVAPALIMVLPRYFEVEAYNKALCTLNDLGVVPLARIKNMAESAGRRGLS